MFWSRTRPLFGHGPLQQLDAIRKRSLHQQRVHTVCDHAKALGTKIARLPEHRRIFPLIGAAWWLLFVDSLQIGPRPHMRDRNRRSRIAVHERTGATILAKGRRASSVKGT